MLHDARLIQPSAAQIILSQCNAQVRKLEAARSSDSAAALAEVTQLVLAPAGGQLAAGYADGSVRVWNLATHDCTVTFSGHKVPGPVCVACSSAAAHCGAQLF